MPSDLEAGRPDTIRLDKWLWAARFFKTRTLAAEAIAGGKVHVNRQRVKPGRDIRVGAVLSVTKDGYCWDITVAALSSQRRPAGEAVLLYRESEESRLERQRQIIDRKRQRELCPDIGREHKPDKKERRLIHRFKRG